MQIKAKSGLNFEAPKIELEALVPPDLTNKETLDNVGGLVRKKLKVYRHCNICGGNDLQGNFSSECSRDGQYDYRAVEVTTP